VNTDPSYFASCKSASDSPSEISPVESSEMDQNYNESKQSEYLVFPVHSPDCQCNKYCSTAPDEDQNKEPESMQSLSFNSNGSSGDKQRVGEIDQLGMAAAGMAIMIAILWWMELQYDAADGMDSC